MEHDVWTIELPRAAAEWHAGSREAVERCLLDELTDQAPDLAGDSCTDSGGWPDDEQVEIVELRIGDQRLEATITVYFEEVVPSACKDMPYREKRQVELVLTMERDDDFAIVNHSHTDPEQWDLVDRNSAADGT